MTLKHYMIDDMENSQDVELVYSLSFFNVQKISKSYAVVHFNLRPYETIIDVSSCIDSDHDGQKKTN